jgi:DNA-binding transcriptional LysR family regulator
LHNLLMVDWSDLRYLLAVARHGSTTAAAKALGVNQSTVHRRLAELERQLGRRLVERYPTGYRLTALGEELRLLAERVEAGVHDFERLAASSEIDLVGTVRVTCPETVGYRMMKTPLLDSFHSRYPKLRIELMMVDRVLDLAKGEADVAFRTAPPQDDALVSRKLADVLWGVFASRSYIEKHGQPEQAADINKHQIIGFGGIIAGHPAAGWLRSVAGDARIAAVCTTTPALMLAVKSGAGLAPLPIAAVKNEPDLVRLLGSAPVLTLHFHLVFHRDMRRTPRVRAFCDFVSEEIKAFRELLVGHTSPPT